MDIWLLVELTSSAYFLVMLNCSFSSRRPSVWSMLTRTRTEYTCSTCVGYVYTPVVLSVRVKVTFKNPVTELWVRMHMWIRTETKVDSMNRLHMHLYSGPVCTHIHVTKVLLTLATKHRRRVTGQFLSVRPSVTTLVLISGNGSSHKHVNILDKPP